eukprot:1615293-Rhodomonas_salina.1
MRRTIPVVSTGHRLATPYGHTRTARRSTRRECVVPYHKACAGTAKHTAESNAIIREDSNEPLAWYKTVPRML